MQPERVHADNEEHIVKNQQPCASGESAQSDLQSDSGVGAVPQNTGVNNDRLLIARLSHYLLFR
jgi:hypothetical protein